MLTILCVCSCESEAPAPVASAPQAYSHGPLSYKVKVRYNVNFTYTPKEPSEAPDYVIHAFQSRLEADGNNGNGYALAEGEAPNMTLDLTLNSDNSNNKSMQVRGYVSDGTFYTYTDNSYQDPGKMINAMADEVNVFVSTGWRGTR
jgi:hypothetical protein